MSIKSDLLIQAKKLGISGTQAKVLSTDPYFVGTDKDIVDAKWASELWSKMMSKRKKPIHLRGFHYWIQSQHTVKPDGEKYAQKDAKKDWTYLLHCVQMARYLGIGEFKNLVDMKHPDPSDYDIYYVGSGLDTSSNNFSIETELTSRIDNFVNSLIDGVVKNHPRYRTDGYQTTHCEIWCEKNSMGFVIEPQCRKYQATYQALVGQSSVEKVAMLCGRALQAANAGKKVRIFYISDNDRYGCFSGSTMITTNANETKIRDIKEGDQLVTMVDNKCELTTVKVKEELWVPVSTMVKLTLEVTTAVNRGTKKLRNSMIVSKKHPIYTLNRGWVNAIDLTKDDILVDTLPSTSHFKNIRPRPTNSEHRKRLMREDPSFLQSLKDRWGAKASKIYWDKISPEERTKLAKDRMTKLKADPAKWAEYRTKCLKGCKTLPSKLEQSLIDEIEAQKLPIEYIGDGRLTYDGKRPFVGGYCPDFHSIGDHKLIEVSDLHFLKAVNIDYEEYKRVRHNAYEKSGYKVLFLANTGNCKGMVETMKKFVVNGATLLDKKEMEVSHLSKLNEQKEIRKAPLKCYLCSHDYKNRNSLTVHLYKSHDMTAPEARECVRKNYTVGDQYEMKVYNLQCTPYDTFIAEGVVVHNMSMPIAVARKLEFMLGDAKADVKVNMLALTNDQVKEFDLPRAPKLGEMVVELDALEAIYPGELGKIVTNAIAPYYDSEKPAIVSAENRRIREEATKLVEENLRKPLEELFAGIDPKGIAKDLDMTTLINPDFTPPEPGKVVDEKDIYWVYDSDRPYWEQWKEYKKNKVSDVGGDD